MSDERWLPVVNYEDLYEVSDWARVRSIPRTFERIRNDKPVEVMVHGRILAQNPDSHGYMQVQLPRMEDGRQRNCRVRVNILMLEAFVGPCPPGWQCRHLNDVPDDNRLENLKWGTPPENRQDSVRNGVHGYTKRTHCKNGHEFTPENTFIRSNGGRGCRTCVREWASKRARTEHVRTRQREYMREYRKRNAQKTSDQQPLTHCPQGHEFTPENTYVTKDGKRHCRECRRVRQRKK